MAKKKKIIVNVSGGKDSTATLLLALKEYKNSDVTILPVFADTGWEHPLTYEYLDYLEKELNIKITKVKSERYTDVADLVKQKRIFPSAMRRICTGELKLKPQFKFMKSLLEEGYELEQWIGIRKDESRSRAKKYGHLNPNEFYDFHTLNPSAPKYLKAIKVRFPVIDMTANDVFKIINGAGLEINPLYHRGHSRVGCFPCILGSTKDFQLVWGDEYGKENILKLKKIEEDLNNAGYMAKLKPQKTCKQLVEELKKSASQLRMFDDDDGSRCGFCSI